MILQSNDAYTQLAEFDPETGSIRFFSRSERDLDDAATPGVFARVGDRVVCFYRWRGRLYVQLGAQRFEIDDSTHAAVKRDGAHRKFVLRRGSEPLVEITYRPAKQPVPIEDDPTPFVSDEDFDIFAFIANVLNDERRRAAVFGGTG